MAYGLEYREDSQLINGNGTAPNLRGILNRSGIGTYAPGTAEARVISIRKAITTVQVRRVRPHRRGPPPVRLGARRASPRTARACSG